MAAQAADGYTKHPAVTIQRVREIDNIIFTMIHIPFLLAPGRRIDEDAGRRALGKHRCESLLLGVERMQDLSCHGKKTKLTLIFAASMPNVVHGWFRGVRCRPRE